MRGWAVLGCAVWLAGCTTLRQSETPVPPAPAAATAPATPALEAPDTSPPGQQPSAAATDSTPSATAAGTVPPCVPPDEKPKTKSKPRPKRAVVRQEPAATALAPPSAEAPRAAEVNADLKVLNTSVESVLGRKVQGLHGEDFGRVVDVLADGSGRVRAAIIDYGGFLGVGNRRIAVEWSLLRADPEHPDEPLTLRITREKLQSAPAYKDSSRPPTLMVP